MAITPFSDISAIKGILDNDPYLDSLGYKSGRIYKFAVNPQELNEKSKYVMIYQGTPASKNNNMFVGVVYNIDVVASNSNWGDLNNAVEQIIALLSFQDIGNCHILELLDPPSTATSPSGIIMSTMSFLCNSTIFNSVKTVD